MSGNVSLVEALTLFNRKERHLLVCRALGRTVQHPPPLDLRFLTDVRQALLLPDEIPCSAWWALDYHLAWIAGALAYFAHGEAALEKVWENLGEKFVENGKEKERFLLEGNQEDADLLIAFGNTMILCEAKAYGAYSNEQSRSKAFRLKLLYKFYEKKIQNLAPLNFYFLHISPDNPKYLKVQWPDWLEFRNKNPALVQMPLPDRVLEPTRCSKKDGEPWVIKEIWKNGAKPPARSMPNPCLDQGRRTKQ